MRKVIIMANPIIVTCDENVWTKVATNVTEGQVKKIDNKPHRYLETYRMTGNAAPTDREEGIPAFMTAYSELISASAGIDVYIMAIGDNGKVRVDLP